MLNLASRSTQAWRSIRRLAKDMATVAERIGDTKVSMSLHEPGAYINYQRIEDNLTIVRKRYASIIAVHSVISSHCTLGSTVLSLYLRKSSMAILMTLITKILSAV